MRGDIIRKIISGNKNPTLRLGEGRAFCNCQHDAVSGYRVEFRGMFLIVFNDG
jgi:hypothetical protein